MAIVSVQTAVGFLLVKVSKADGISDDVAGKVFAIPEGALAPFLVAPDNQGEIDSALGPMKIVNLDYAAYLIDYVIAGSSGG